MEIQYFHRYNRLVRRGLVKPLACPLCDNPFTLRATEDGDPVLQCNWCQTLAQPGASVYNQVKAVVTEHFG